MPSTKSSRRARVARPAADPRAIRARAVAALRRGPTLADAPDLALAALRFAGDPEIGPGCYPWRRIWQWLPADADPSSAEAAEVVRYAAEVAALEAERRALRRAGPDPVHARRIFEEFAHSHGERLPVEAIHDEASRRAIAAHEDRLLTLRGQLKAMEQTLEDQLGLLVAATRRRVNRNGGSR